MPTYTYNVDFSELWTLLFKKKVCPACGTRLNRRSEHQTDSKPRWHGDGGGLRWQFWYGTEVKVTPYYECDNCSVKYSLMQLRHGMPGDPVPPDSREPK